MTPDDLITPVQACKILACHRATIYRYMQSGELRSWRRAGKRLLVSANDVRRLLEPRRRDQQPPPPPSKAELDKRHQDAVAELRAAGMRF